ncbi:MAG: hypothetical protein LAO30_04385 [Acidobacteriia bacterium]|nr:hypothetical protein [Terriglobia bacterium]
MAREVLLIGILSSLIAALLAAVSVKIFPTLRALWAGMRPLSVGDTVSWNNGNYLITETRGGMFTYQYKLVNFHGINPFLLPAICFDPKLAGDAMPFWYKASNGRCYLKKTGHPRLELKLPLP